MGLVKSENSTSWQSHLWRMDEDMGYLHSRFPTDIVIDPLTHQWNQIRQCEWLTARWMFLHLFGIEPQRIKSTTEGKPYLEGDKRNISMSHTRNYVMIAISDQPIGIDIQVSRMDIAKIAPKFCTDYDISQWPMTMSSLDKHHHIWSAKEALFKGYGLGNINFKEHLKTQDIQQLSPVSFLLKGQVTKSEPSQKYTIHSASWQDLYSAIAIGHY